MNDSSLKQEFDVIVVGSGTCGATIARELSRQKKKVLVLEQGTNRELKESFLSAASIANAVTVSDKLATMRAITTGGSTALYFAVAEPPALDSFQALGIDLSKVYENVKKELPLSTLPDHLLGEQSKRLRDSAIELGYDWKKKMMLIDQSKCDSGYSYEARWKAKSYLQEAIANGATLITRAKVDKIIIEKNRAIGVEYKHKNNLISQNTCKAYATKIILAAGSLASPLILRNSGIKDAGKHGFYCCPNFAALGFIPGLKGTNNFVGNMSAKLDEDIVIGDANLSSTFFKMVMLAEFKFSKFFSYSNSIAVGGSIKDGISGEIMDNGRYYKKLSAGVYGKLKRGEEAGIKILQNAGAKNIMRFGYASANVGGLIRINEHVDESLQTEYTNLHVCDGSVLPENSSLSPTLTLICLAKYLSEKLSSSL